MKMKALKSAVLAAAASLFFVSTTPVAATAADGPVFSENHTDGFYVVTDTGTPVLKTRNGLANTVYDGNATFIIDPSAYDDGSYEFAQFEKTGHTAYYSVNQRSYFEPGWSGNPTGNGFTALGVLFTDVKGPGELSLYGNNLTNDEDISPVLAGDQYFIRKGTYLPILGHTHAHWYFQKAGDYTFKVVPLGVKNGEVIRGEEVTQTYKVTKSEDDSSPASPVVDRGEDPTAKDRPQGVRAEDLSSSAPAPKEEPSAAPSTEPAPTPTDTPSTQPSEDVDADAPADGETSAAPSADAPEPDTKDTETPGTDESQDTGSGWNWGGLFGDNEDDGTPDWVDSPPAAWKPVETPATLAGGHLDAFYVYSSDLESVDLLTKEDITGQGVIRTPESARFVMNADTYETGLEYKLPGGETTGYISPSVKAKKGLYPGFASNQYTKNEVKNAKVVFESITGPGKLAFMDANLDGTFQTVLDGGKYYVEDGASFSVPASYHKHTHWIFTKPGKYVIKAKVVAETESGPVESSLKTYNWFVKPNDADPNKDAAGDLSELDKAPEAKAGDPKTNAPDPSASESPKAEETPKTEEPSSAPSENDDTTPEAPKASFPWVELVPGIVKPTPAPEPSPAPTSAPTPKDNETLAPKAPVEKKLEIARGHIDLINVSADGKKLVLNAKDDTTGETPVLRAPESFYLRVSDKSKRDIPGKLAKETAPNGYLLSQNGEDQTYAPFAGWDTTLVQPAYEQIRIHFNKVTTPEGGKVFMFGSDRRGKLVSPLEGGNMELNSGDSILQETPMHVHTSWLFTQPGVYTMKVQAEDAKGALAAGSLMGLPKADSVKVKSNEATYTWLIGDATEQPAPSTTPTPNAEADTPEMPQPGDSALDAIKDQLAEISGKLDTLDAILDAINKAKDPSVIEAPDAPKAEATPMAPQTSQAPEQKGPDASVTTPVAPETQEPPAQADPQTKVTLFDHGHFDLFNVFAKDGKVLLAAKEDTTGKPVLHKPESIALRVKSDRFIITPDTFPSIFPKEVFFLPANDADTSQMVWPGWDTSAVRPNFEATKIVFDKVEGPGQVFLSRSDAFGGVAPALKSGNFAISAGDYIDQVNPAHVHANWMFEKEGIYTFTVHAESTPVMGGDPVKSNVGVYTIVVGDNTKLPGAVAPKAEQKKPQTPKKKTGEHKNTGSNTQSTSNGTSEATTTGTGDGSSNAGADPAPSATYSSSSAGGSTREACTFVPDKSANEVSAKEAKPNTPAAGNAGLNLVPMVKDDRAVPAKWVSPSSLTFGISNAGKATTPQNIGAISQGTPVWMISSSQVGGVPWLGMNTQHPSALENISGATSISLTSFSGPGMMEVFTSGNLGNAVGQAWFSGNGNRGSGTATIPANTHVHPNWMFTKEGTYKVGLTLSATTKDGKRVSGNTTLTFVVGGSGSANSGHFDFGPQLVSGSVAADTPTSTSGSAVSSMPKGKWVTASGAPCTPSKAELKAAGFPSNLSYTGTVGVPEGLVLMLTAIAVGSVLVGMRKKRY
ncbi:putative ABC transporter-associated repeat protein [Arcanobacterium wilhelmae]|uniref:ABC transporter-associated repeat protein n=1 Tax=Arcanobacterium wilhelmae TaxID=1803177 RepID=A0ABT9NCY6_9ACTO|nr:TIGR03773 family transporter-associated surface protein [Arcanobacterium wilhelmae]MDP9801574.1 putative ABC transporter-associated repeat protein [Arcanobacterium wilhelmae]WFN90901.1 TIGR03773 family transporter-associated surface protein [Arcanobacterium wilhelmae]